MKTPTDPAVSAFARIPRALLLGALFCVSGVVALSGCSSKHPTQPTPTPPLSSLTIDVQVDTLRFGETKVYTVTAVDTNGVTVSVNPTWQSSNAAVFTVSAAGRVTPQSEGTAFLIATAGGQQDFAAITVIPGGGWIVQQSNATPSNLNGVFFDSGGRRGWAVGSGGWIVATTDAGETWTRQNSNATNADLYGVWFVSYSEGWVVGTGATVRHTVDGGATWQVVQTNVASEDLFDVVFANPDTGWAVGATGVVLRTADAGSTWTRKTPTASKLNSVSFAGAWNGWAVGDNGVILGTHDAGQSWFTVTPSVTASNLQSVWRRSESMAWAAGLVGVAPRTVSGADSTMWLLGSAGANRQLYGVCFPSDAVGYAVGSDGGVGAVLRSDDGGLSWQAQTSGAQLRLNGVFFVDEQRGWAVGNSGTIVHTATGGLP